MSNRQMRTLTINGITYDVAGLSDEEIQAKIDVYLQDGVIEETVEDWLDDHPEATTTVQDGSVSMQKLSSDVQSVIASAGVKMPSVVPVGKLFDTGYVYSSWVHNNQYHLHKLRLYSRALTADEVRNNFKYESNLVS